MQEMNFNPNLSIFIIQINNLNKFLELTQYFKFDKKLS